MVNSWRMMKPSRNAIPVTMKDLSIGFSMKKIKENAPRRREAEAKALKLKNGWKKDPPAAESNITA